MTSDLASAFEAANERYTPQTIVLRGLLLSQS